MVSGIEMAARTLVRIFSTSGKIAQQAGAAVAGHHFLHRTSEVDIDDIEAHILAMARGVRHHGRIGTEQLRGNRMLVGLEIQVAERARGFGRARRGARCRASW